MDQNSASNTVVEGNVDRRAAPPTQSKADFAPNTVEEGNVNGQSVRQQVGLDQNSAANTEVPRNVDRRAAPLTHSEADFAPNTAVDGVVRRRDAVLRLAERARGVKGM